MNLKLLSVVAVALLLVGIVYADYNDLPFTITRIKYANGTLYSGYNLTNITLYDDYSAGNILFSQERFTHFDNGTAVFFLYDVDDTTLNREFSYAQVKIDSTTFTPRFNLSRTKPYNSSQEVYNVINNGTFQKNVTSKICTGTDKFSSYSDGVFTCSADQTGGGGGSISGIQSLNDSYLNVVNGTLTNITINLTGFNTLYCSRNDWTTINDYPSNCAAGNYVYGLGDSLSCRADLYNSSADIWAIAGNGTLALTSTVVGNCSANQSCELVVYQDDWIDCTKINFSGTLGAAGICDGTDAVGGAGGGGIGTIQSLNETFINVQNGSITNISVNFTGFDGRYAQVAWTNITYDSEWSSIPVGGHVTGTIGDIVINTAFTLDIELENSTIIRKGNTSWAWNVANNGSFVLVNDWTSHNNYPAACGTRQYATTIGDTLTCSVPPYNSTAEIKAAQSYWNSTDVRFNQSWVNNISISNNESGISFANGCKVIANSTGLIFQC